MRRLSHAGALALAALAACSLAQEASAERHALLIGIGRYADSRIKPLEGPVHDVQALRSLLVERWGFAAEDVRVLVDAEASRARILEEIRALVERTRSGDHVLIYFSGHGTSRFDPKVALPMAHDTGALVPADFGWLGTSEEKLARLLVGQRDLRPQLQALDEGGRQVLVVIDACFAENASRGLYRSLVGRPELPGRVTVDPFGDAALAGYAIGADPGADSPYPYQHVVTLAASSRRETAADIGAANLRAYPTFDGKPHGAFSDAIQRVLRGELGGDANGDGTLSYLELHRAAQAFMTSRGYSQTPMIQPNQGGAAIAQLTRAVHENPGVEAGSPQRCSDPKLRVRLDAVGASIESAVRGAPGVEVDGADPDYAFGLEGQELRVVSRDAELVGRIPASPERAAAWLKTRAWMKRLACRSAAEQPFFVVAQHAGEKYAEGETVRFGVAPERDAYVAMLSLESEGAIHFLYPWQSGQIRPVSPESPLLLPEFRVEAPFGIEEVVVLAFEREPADLAPLLGRKIDPGDETTLAQLDRALVAGGRAASTTLRLVLEPRESRP
jgi:hypothetical protein